MFNLCNIFQFVILNDPDYTVSDEDIIKFIWKGQSNVQINTFCSAGNKLGKRLEQAGCDYPKSLFTFAASY